jgi:hypothetical protein
MKKRTTKKWGKLGAPKSAKRRAWMRSIAKKSKRKSRRR